jgi:hypothetical protein
LSNTGRSGIRLSPRGGVGERDFGGWRFPPSFFIFGTKYENNCLGIFRYCNPGTVFYTTQFGKQRKHERRQNMKRHILKDEKYVPNYNTPGLGGWAYRYAVRNLWRVFPDYDLDDLISESMLAFAKCLKAYPDANEVHYAALFRTTFTRQVTNMANERRAKFTIAQTDLTPEDGESIEPQTDNGYAVSEAELTMLTKEAPPHIQNLVQGLATRVEETGLRPRRMKKGSRLETINEFLCRVAGVDSTLCQMADELLDWLRFGEFNRGQNGEGYGTV